MRTALALPFLLIGALATIATVGVGWYLLAAVIGGYPVVDAAIAWAVITGVLVATTLGCGAIAMRLQGH